jgi:hypothetical protein
MNSNRRRAGWLLAGVTMNLAAPWLMKLVAPLTDDLSLRLLLLTLIGSLWGASWILLWMNVEHPGLNPRGQFVTLGLSGSPDSGLED